MIIDSGVVTGSLQVSGSLSVQGATTLTGPIIITSGSISGSIDSASFASTASYVNTLNQDVLVNGILQTTDILYALSGSITRLVADHLTVNPTNVITGSIENAIIAQTASFAPNYLPVTGGTINGNLIVAGTASITYLNTTYESASVIYSSGSNVFGDALGDTHQFTGSVLVTGSLSLNNSSVIVTADTASMSVLQAQSASVAGQAISAFTASYVTLAQTASYVANAVSASRASSAQNADNAATASIALNALTASYVPNALTASYILNAVSASYSPYALTSSYAIVSATASSAEDFVVRGLASIGGEVLNGTYQVYVTTSINDGTFALDSSAETNALYFLKGGLRKFEISTAGDGTPITQLLPYTSSGFFRIGNPSNASSDLIFVSEPVHGNVLLGPGILTGSTAVSGAQSTDKVQLAGDTYISGALNVIGSVTSLGGFTGSLLGNAQTATLAATATSAPAYVTTASYNAASASFSTRTTNLESFSSSLDTVFATDAQLNTATASLQAGVTSSIATAVSNLQAGVTSSISTAVSNLQAGVTSSIADLNSAIQSGVTASIAGFATTGSNNFIGNQDINGFLTVSNNVFLGQTSTNEVQVTSSLKIANTAYIGGINTQFGTAAEVTGAIDQLGNYNLNGNLTLSGSTYLGRTSSDDVQVTGSLKVANTAYIGGINTQFGTAAEVTGAVYLLGTQDINGNLIVSGGTYLGTDSTDSIQISGSLRTLNTSFIGGDSTVFGTAAIVSGAVYQLGDYDLYGDLIVSGGTYLGRTSSDDVQVTGSLKTQNTAYIGGDSTVFGTAAIISGAVYLQGTQDIQGNLILSGSTYLGRSSSDDVQVTGSLKTSNTAYIGNASTQFGTAAEVTGAIKQAGNLEVTGSIGSTQGIYGTIYADNNVVSSSQQILDYYVFATTGSNNFLGTQYVANTTNATSFDSTAALYTDGGLRVTKDTFISGGLSVAGNFTVYGTASVNYVTSSVLVGLEFIDLNTDLPALRYAGINVQDSGSATGNTASFWYDSQNNDWVFVHEPSGSADVNSSVAMFGPLYVNDLGNEKGIQANYIVKAQNTGEGHDHHLTASIMTDDGSQVTVAGAFQANNLTGSLDGSNLVDGSVANTKLANSAITIAGNSTSLGGSITAGTILTGTSVFSGSAQIPNSSITNAQLANSAITIAGSSTSLGGSITAATILSGTGVFSGSAQISAGSITNAQLANSTISGIALGSNLGTLTIGTGLSGTSYNGSTGVTIANTGVTAFNTRTGGVTLQASDISGLAAGIFSGSAQIPATSITNAQLVNSAVTVNGSSISLGGSATITAVNPNALTIGTGLSGTSYNGSGAVTIANTGVLSITSNSGLSSNVSATGNVTITNTGVTSNVAGTGVSVSGATGAVTISIGQAVATSSNVQFNSLGVGTAGSGTAGEIRATADITAYYSSDERLKEEITPIENPIEKLMAINGVTFNWKEGFDDVHSHKGADTGVIAQQIEAIGLPDTVTTRENGYKAVKYEKLVALLIESLKVHQNELTSVKAELEEIKARLK